MSDDIQHIIDEKDAEIIALQAKLDGLERDRQIGMDNAEKQQERITQLEAELLDCLHHPH